jgi:hypothetical protein
VFLVNGEKHSGRVRGPPRCRCAPGDKAISGGLVVIIDIVRRLEKKRGMSESPRECIWYPVCPMKRYYASGRLDERWVRQYCHGHFERCVRYQLEAKGAPHPDWMLPDGRLDERLRGY